MTVHVERRNRVAIITIDRPERRNAIDEETAHALDRALRAAEEDNTVGAVVLTGAGTRAFSSGADLKEFSDHGPSSVVPTIVFEGGFCGITERFYAKPLIAAVNGAAVAGGWELALACDLIVASETTYFRS